MAKILGVKFKNTAKIYYFAPADENSRYKVDSGVIVETAKGLEYGTVTFDVKEVDDKEIVHPLKKVVRQATAKDEKIIADNQKKIPETMRFAEQKILERKLDMKLIGCEYSFDGKKILFYFSAENRIDFRELVKDLATHFHVRIELKQIGIRDEAKLLGGIAPCGRACCCSCGVSDFGRVTIKMAKTQGLHLNPTKISGLCGRLMCCLEYESEYYADAYKKMPKVGGTVKTPEGEGTVIAIDMLKMECKVKIAKGDGAEVYKDFPVKQLNFKNKKNDNDKDDGDDVHEDIKKMLD